MTYLEAYMKEFPGVNKDDVIANGCPDVGWEDIPEDCYVSNRSSVYDYSSCIKCWNREIPGSVPTVHQPNQAEREEFWSDEPTETVKENNDMCDTTKKTKAQLIEEINNKNGEICELKRELEKFEKYAKYDEMAGEMFAIKSSLINAGFNDSEAFTLMIEMIKTSCKTR